eukprot:CFRG5634T1
MFVTIQRPETDAPLKLETSPATTVLNVKKQISESNGTPTEKINLNYKGYILRDDDELGSVGNEFVSQQPGFYEYITDEGDLSLTAEKRKLFQTRPLRWYSVL